MDNLHIGSAQLCKQAQTHCKDCTCLRMVMIIAIIIVFYYWSLSLFWFLDRKKLKWVFERKRRRKRLTGWSQSRRQVEFIDDDKCDLLLLECKLTKQTMEIVAWPLQLVRTFVANRQQFLNFLQLLSRSQLCSNWAPLSTCVCSHNAKMGSTLKRHAQSPPECNLLARSPRKLICSMQIN